MARLWSSGFELNTTGANVEFASASGTPVIGTSVVHSGDYAMETSSLVSGTSRHLDYIFIGIATAGPLYFRFYFRYDTLPTAPNTVFRLLGGGTTVASVRLSNTGALILAVTSSNTVVGTSSTILTQGAWHMVEVLFDATPAGGSEVIELKIDGSVEVTSSTQTLAANLDRIRFGGNIGNLAQTTGVWYIDDIAVNDSTGSAQTGYPGEGSIVHLRPNANGDNAMGSRGGADSGSDWGQIDEVTPNDATDYYILDVDNDIIDVGVDSSSDAGIGSSDTISLVQVGIRLAGASAAQYTGNVRLKSASGGTTTNVNVINASETSFFTNGTLTGGKNYLITSYTDPTTGVPWTPTGTNSLDNMQIGALAVDATPDIYVSTLWALVEYVPAGGGGYAGDIKKISSVLQASQKKINGVAQAAIKKVSGVSNV